MIKTMIQAVFFSITLHLLYWGYQVIRGYVAAHRHVPNLLETDAQVNVLVSERAFGAIHSGWFSMVFSLTAATFAFLLISYMIRTVRAGHRK